jgi:antitoxin component YwqK of YwqJK toxin-antitoxin module
MKKLFIIILTFLINSVYSQDQSVIDTNKVKQKASFYTDSISISEKYSFFKYYKVFDDTILINTYYILDTNSVRVLHGSACTFSQGRITRILNFNLGKKEGNEYRFTVDSKFVESQIEYKNDTINGLVIKYYSNGSPKEIGNCFGMISLRYGNWVSFYEDGNKKSEGLYGVIRISDKFELDNVQINSVRINNIYEFVPVKIGEWIYYNNDGSIKKKEIYTKPKLVINNN